MNVEIFKSNLAGKKYKIIINNNNTKKTIHIGQSGADDYTITKDKEQKERYINRHTARENWNKSGIKTAGFWSRYLTWNKPTITESIKDIETKFNIKIKKNF